MNERELIIENLSEESKAVRNKVYKKVTSIISKSIVITIDEDIPKSFFKAIFDDLTAKTMSGIDTAAYFQLSDFRKTFTKEETCNNSSVSIAAKFNVSISGLINSERVSILIEIVSHNKVSEKTCMIREKFDLSSKQHTSAQSIYEMV